MPDATRQYGRHKKRGVSVMALKVNLADLNAASAFVLGVLPESSLLMNAWIVQTIVGSVALSTADISADGNLLFNDYALTSVADTVTADVTNIHLPTGGDVTITPSADLSAGTGQLWVMLEYIEYEQCTGELTNFGS